MAAAGERWGQQLEQPLFDAEALSVIRLAFKATERYQRNRSAANGLRARQARALANFTPPESHWFRYRLKQNSIITTTQLNVTADRWPQPLPTTTIQHRPKAVGEYVMGNRLRFNYDLPELSRPNAMYLDLVLSDGSDPGRKIQLQVGRSAIDQLVVVEHLSQDPLYDLSKILQTPQTVAVQQ